MVVLVGTVALGHFTEAGQVIVLPAVASLARIRVNEYAPEERPVVLNVNVQLPVRVDVITFPFARVSVCAVPVLPAALIVSEGAVRIGVAIVGEVPNTRAPEPVSFEHALANCAEVNVTVLLPRSIVLLVNVLVEETVGTTTPSTARTPAEDLESVVSVA